MVRQPGILRQHRPVQVGGVHLQIAGPFGAVLAVVAGSGDDPPERPRAGAEVGAAAVVLEAHHAGGLTCLAEVAGHGDVTHEPGAATFGDRVKHPYSGDWRRADGGVVLAEKLVAGAHGEHDGAGLDRLAQRPGLRLQVAGRHPHLAVLAAVQQDQVKIGEVGGFPDVGIGDAGPDPPPGTAPGHGEQVAAVPGHAEQPRVQMADADRHRSGVLHVIPPRTAAPSRVVA